MNLKLPDYDYDFGYFEDHVIRNEIPFAPGNLVKVVKNFGMIKNGAKYALGWLKKLGKGSKGTK